MSQPQTLPSNPPAGWYDDPTEPILERWWTGSEWTLTRRVSTTTTPSGQPVLPTVVPGPALSELTYRKTGVLPTPPGRAVPIKRRALAHAADLLIAFGVPVTAAAVAPHFGVSSLGSVTSHRTMVFALVLAVMNHVVFVACFGTTTGKRLLRLEIVDHLGRKPTPWRTVLRFAAQLLVYATATLPFALVPGDSTMWTDDVARIGSMFLCLFVLAIPVLVTGRTAWDRTARTTVVAV